MGRLSDVTLLIGAALLGGFGAGCPEPAQPPPPEAADLGAPDFTDDDPDLAPPALTGPALLRDTGLYADFAARTLAPGVITYTPRYELWADGADKDRYLLLPPGTTIDTRDMDRWVFPVGTKAWKQFRVGGRLVETRLLLKVAAGFGFRGWFKVAYAWNEAGTEATAQPDGVKDALGTTHDVPTQKDCDKCHRAASDVLLGVGAIQLSAADGNGMLSQLARAGRLSVDPKREFQVPGTGAVQAALGYLHANCGICHNNRSPLAMERAQRLDVSVNDKVPADTATYRTTFGTPLLHELPGGVTQVVVPGKPEKSGLLYRMRQRGDDWDMPPVATKVVDATGSAAIEAWIAQLPPN